MKTYIYNIISLLFTLAGKEAAMQEMIVHEVGTLIFVEWGYL
jgi:hypothetical protein